MKLFKDIKTKNQRISNDKKNLHDLNSLNRNQISVNLPKELGHPTSLTLCNYSKNIYVGYSSGSVEKYNSNVDINGNNYNDNLYNSNNNRNNTNNTNNNNTNNNRTKNNVSTNNNNYYSNSNENDNGNSRSMPLHFDTATVHASSVRAMITISLPQTHTTRNQKIPRRVLVLVVCDDSGIISVWKIGETAPESIAR